METLDIKNALIVTYKLVNTLKSNSFNKSLLQLWDVSESRDNILAIQSKVKNDLDSKMDRFNRHYSYDVIFDYLDQLAREKKIVLRKSDMKGLIKEISFEEYRLVRTFIYKVSAQYHTFFQYQNGQFHCHELVGGILDYFLIKDGIENGTGLDSLDKIINDLLKNKPSQFFSNGYINDLFISDRLQIAEFPFEVVSLRSRKSYLSTCAIANSDYIEKDLENFEIFRVA
jgi:hypothetical protein